MCIKFLSSQAGLHYVLTRSFSFDAVEATFAHVRRGGSNDAIDVRAAEYAMYLGLPPVPEWPGSSRFYYTCPGEN